jgi:hypothetical protein
MPKPKKRKRKIKLSQMARVRKKNEEKNDTMPRMQGRPPANVAPTFRVKIKKKQ